MYMVVEKSVKKVQRGEVSFSSLKEFWGDKRNRSVILFVYEKEELLSLISYMDFWPMKDEESLSFYIDYVHNNKVWENCDESDISDALENRKVTYLILQEPCADREKAVFAYRYITDEIHYYASRIKKCLEDRGIRVFRVNIPTLHEIRSDNRGNIPLNYAYYSDFLAKEEFHLPPNINKITNLSACQLKPVKSLLYQKLGRGGKKIYLVGPCIVAGVVNPPGERLGDILYQKMRDWGLEGEYEIKFVTLGMDESMRIYQILEYDISSEDLVILIHYNMYECELDLTELFASWSGEQWLYQDIPIHATVAGNEKIADAIIEKIIKKAHAEGVKGEIEMWHGEPQFAPKLEFEIAEYIKKIRGIREFPQGSVIGAIVMNCNPFTLGHRYLIEYAAARVDYLYIFAVEEDLSVFPFCDRYFLIREGVGDIPNVVVVPSGQFIISRVTFFSYFKKEMYTENVNAEEDVYIFARYIAKGLGITRRFVGEEPADKVTDSYNRKMKEVFPRYGIELVEIPRKQTEEGELISASKVRALLEEGRWEEIGRLVPASTLEYLKRNREEIQRRSCRKMLMLKSCDDPVSEIIRRICGEEKMIIYTIGEDTCNLLKKIPREVQARLVYADKTASDKAVYFQGKQVAAPNELLSTYREYMIVIPTVKYGSEIYGQFIQMGIDLSRCIFNTSRLS